MAATPSPSNATFGPEPTAKEKSDAMAKAQMAGLFGSMADFLSQPSHRHWAGVGPAPKTKDKNRAKKKSRNKMAKASRRKNR